MCLVGEERRFEIRLTELGWREVTGWVKMVGLKERDGLNQDELGYIR